MLVLTRRKGESIIIGDGIVITINDLSANKVHIGIDAPKNILVRRKELHERILVEGENPSKPKPEQKPVRILKGGLD